MITVFSPSLGISWDVQISDHLARMLFVFAGGSDVLLLGHALV